MNFFGNKYVKGITQFIQADHFGAMDFIDYHCQRMGISRDEYMAYYVVSESVNEADSDLAKEVRDAGKDDKLKKA